MPTTYRVLDAVLAGNSYRVTVQVNKDNMGNMVFTSSAPRITSDSLSPGDCAMIASWLLSAGLSLATLRTQTYTVN